MKNFNLSNYELVETEGVFTLKNINTTVGLSDLMILVKLNIFL